MDKPASCAVMGKANGGRLPGMTKVVSLLLETKDGGAADGSRPKMSLHGMYMLQCNREGPREGCRKKGVFENMTAGPEAAQLLFGSIAASGRFSPGTDGHDDTGMLQCYEQPKG